FRSGLPDVRSGDRLRRGRCEGALRAQRADPFRLRALALAGLTERHASKAHTVARLELADLPSFRTYDRRGADEAAEVRSIRAHDHGHGAGEGHRTERIRM